MIGFLEILDDQKLDTWMKMNGSLIKSSTIVEFSFQHLMEEIKPMVAEKKEFEFRDVSIMIALFRKFGLSGL